MAKKSSTINIEEFIWNEIAAYMKDHDITNRNTAIEWMLIERKALLSKGNEAVPELKKSPEPILYEDNPQEDDELIDSNILSDIYSGMS